MPRTPEENKIYMRQWYISHKEHVRLRGIEYRKANKEKIKKQRDEHRDEIRDRRRAAFLDHGEYSQASIAQMSEWRRKHPEAARAHKKLYAAIAAGIIVRPDSCESCLRDISKIHAHHDDYAKPLEVKWLCGSCHRRLHLQIISQPGTVVQST